MPMLDPLAAITDAFTSFLFGKVETTRLPVRTSTGQAQAVYMPTAAPGLGDSGVIIGREVYSGKGYIYDPFQLYGQQLPAPTGWSWASPATASPPWRRPMSCGSCASATARSSSWTRRARTASASGTSSPRPSE